jgi:hypothetical protein
MAVTFLGQHAKMDRFVIRNGDVGEICTFDTEEQLGAAFPDYQVYICKKIAPSHRKDIY